MNCCRSVRMLFSAALLLVVLCGVGRGAAFTEPQAVPEKPRIPARVIKAYGKPKVGVYGEKANGLQLAAHLAVPIVRGESATLWLTLKNVSEDGILLFLNYWDLDLSEKKPSRYGSGSFILLRGNYQFGDFLLLRPDETVQFLMDADSSGTATGYAKGYVSLKFPVPMGMSKKIKGRPWKLLPGNTRIGSGAIDLSWTAAPKRPADLAAVDALLSAYLNKKRGAETALAAKGKAAGASLRRAMRSRTEWKRWAAMQFICGHPEVGMKDELLDFLARWGPRAHDGRMLARLYKGASKVITTTSLHRLLSSYGDGLPEQQRPGFFLGAAAAMPYDYRECGSLASRYTVVYDQEKLAAAARIFRFSCERGDTRADVLGFAAWQMFVSTDPELRDLKAARKYTLRALRSRPNDHHLRMILDVMSGKLDKVSRAAAASGDASALNGVAWKLALIPKPTPEQSALAITCAKRALQLVGEKHRRYPYILDTLAAAQSGAGSLKAAVTSQERALKLLPGNSRQRPGYVKRLVLYLARGAAPAEKRPVRLRDLDGTAVRDALLARFKQEPAGSELARVLAAALVRCYPKDAAVQKAIGKSGATKKPGELF
jgi:hypothetical protein